MQASKPKTKRSIELDNKIINLYLSGKDTYDVADEFNCSQTFVINTLKRHNIQRRSTKHYTTKYIANLNFFDKIDTEEKAYTLGFFYADGNNYVKGVHSYEVSMGLQDGDKCILERFRDFLSPDTQLKFEKLSKQNPNWKDQFKLKINSKKMTEQLTALGCVRAKSLILTWPAWLIDPDLQKHFIRGYFDGDGSIWENEPQISGQIDWGWKITSSSLFCASVKQLIESLVDVNCSYSLSHPEIHDKTSSISIGGNIQVKTVLDWMYKDATIYLPRKFEKCQKFLKYLTTRPPNTHSTRKRK